VGRDELNFALAHHTSIATNIAIYLIVGLLVGLVLPQLVMIWLG
jgi:hypothetical protein